MRQLYRPKHLNGKTIRQYSTTFLLLGSMSSFASAPAIHAMYAEQSFEHALKQSMVAEFSLEYGDTATALHNYTVLAIRNDSTLIKQRALDVALEYNDLQAALDIATHWVEQEPQDVPALFYLSHIALKAHKYELAAKTLDKIVSIDPSADLEQILAGISPEFAQDQEILRKALRNSQEKNNPSILALIAALEAQDGLYVQALQNINRALRQRPKSTSFILMKANLLMALQDDAATQQWFAKASQNNPKNIDLRLAEARYYIQINQQQRALSKLESIIKDHPKAEEALFIAGLTSIDLKQDQKAEQYLVELRSSAKYQNEAYYYLAINAQRKQHYETAQTYYRMVGGSLYMVSRRNMLSIFEKQGQLDDGLRFLTQERVNYPLYASFLYQAQADILKKMGNKKAALALLDEAIQALPDDPELIYAEVLLLDPYADRDKLDQTLKQLLQLEPNSPTYLNAYAYTLALQNRRLKEARLYAERALNFAPEQASILDTLGYIAFLQNDFDTAVKVLGQAYTLSQNPNIGIRYAKALYMQGALPQFSEVLQQLKKNHANHPQLQQLDSLILPVNIKKS